MQGGILAAHQSPVASCYASWCLTKAWQESEKHVAHHAVHLQNFQCCLLWSESADELADLVRFHLAWFNFTQANVRTVTHVLVTNHVFCGQRKKERNIKQR